MNCRVESEQMSTRSTQPRSLTPSSRFTSKLLPLRPAATSVAASSPWPSASARQTANQRAGSDTGNRVMAIPEGSDTYAFAYDPRDRLIRATDA